LKKEDIHFDLTRLLFGNAPPEFLAEVFIRTIFIYISLLIVVKLLGKRMSGQLTITEMAVLIMLGAIVGSPIQIPDRGIFISIAILFCLLSFQSIVNALSFKNEKFEQLLLGKSAMLVKDGVLQLDQMKKERVSTQQVFALLREHQIKQLGEVKRVYLESCGIFSVFKSSHPRPGLAVFPGEDSLILSAYPNKIKNQFACQWCGNLSDQHQSACPVCGHNQWITAIQ
jgi:uncharacterized membrane protein YcaP (DUF421 family)